MSFQSNQTLLREHSYFIRALAFELLPSTGGKLRCRELFHIGVGGMLEAAQRFDPALGERFWTFAYPRVRGEMIDAIRREMPVPYYRYGRLTVARAAVGATVAGTRAHQEATQRLADATEAVALFSPEVLAIARGEVLGVEDGRPGAPLAGSDELDELPAPPDDGSSLVMRIDQPGADEKLETAQRDAALHAALGQLTIEERMIVRGLYFEGRGLLDQELGLSKSWASRIHTRALRRLKKMLAREWAPEARQVRPWSPEDTSSAAVVVLHDEGVAEPVETELAEPTDISSAA